MAAPRTLFDRIWQSHVVVDRGDGYHLLYVDRHLMHDGSGPGFAGLRERGLKVRRPELALATPDHYTSTAARTLEAIPDPQHRGHVEQMRENTREAGIERFFFIDDARQGIAHVVSPEQGLTQPGITLVCGDSHTATHGALGAQSKQVGPAVAGPASTRCDSASAARSSGSPGSLIARLAWTLSERSRLCSRRLPKRWASPPRAAGRAMVAPPGRAWA